jgi:hypothetical protein
MPFVVGGALPAGADPVGGVAAICATASAISESPSSTVTPLPATRGPDTI